VETFALADANAALDRLRAGKLLGAAVLAVRQAGMSSATPRLA
jgi:hypothetical protein